MKLIYLIILFFLLMRSAKSQIYELLCPAGSSPIYPVGVTFNQSTGQYRQWLCVDINGNVNISGGSGNVTGTFTSGLIPVANGLHSLTNGSISDDGAGNISWTGGLAIMAPSSGLATFAISGNSFTTHVARVCLGACALGVGVNDVAFMNAGGGATVGSVFIGNAGGNAVGGPIKFQNSMPSSPSVAAIEFQLDATGHIGAPGPGTAQVSPTITAGCGTSPSITPVTGLTDTLFTVNVGTGGVATSCTVTFSAPYTIAPRCFTNYQGAITTVRAVPTTTTVVLDSTAALVASSKIDVACFGN